LTLPDALRNFATRIAVLDAGFRHGGHDPARSGRQPGGGARQPVGRHPGAIQDQASGARISAHGRITGWILACLPPYVAALSFVLSPSHLNTLLGDDLGIKMIWSAVIMQVVGTLIIRKIVDVEY
jgi:tight adherence protein B